MKPHELKFRAWDPIAKEMSPAFSLFGEFTLLGAFHAWQSDARGYGTGLKELSDLEVMRFTGLHDRNGTEIWEHDFLESDDSYYNEAYHYVFWDEYYLCWHTIKFCEGNERLYWRDDLFGVRHYNPLVIERPKWITDERIKKLIK